MGYYQDTPTRSHKSHKCQTPPVSSASSHWGDFWDFWQCPETKTETERNLGNLGGHMLSENQQEKSTGQHMSTSMLPLSIDFLWFLVFACNILQRSQKPWILDFTRLLNSSRILQFGICETMGMWSIVKHLRLFFYSFILWGPLTKVILALPCSQYIQYGFGQSSYSNLRNMFFSVGCKLNEYLFCIWQVF